MATRHLDLTDIFFLKLIKKKNGRSLNSFYSSAGAVRRLAFIADGVIDFIVGLFDDAVGRSEHRRSLLRLAFHFQKETQAEVLCLLSGADQIQEEEEEEETLLEPLELL